MEGIASKTIKELAPLIENKEVSPVEVTKEVLERTEKLNPKINAFIEIRNEYALEQAKIAEEEIMKGKYRGKLHGIPVALKDNIYVKDQVTTMGSKIHKDFVPSYHATVVEKLRTAGAILTGSLNMHEYALGGTNNNPHFGPCRNPWNLNKTSSGSSGGSGASVTADMVYATLGTDTLGSIRGPSAANGVIGLKPTYGLVSKYGVFPLAWSLDHVGPFTKSVYDAAIMLENLVGYDENDPASVEAPEIKYTEHLTEDLSGLTVGIIKEYMDGLDSKIENVLNDGLNRLQELGATIKEVSFPLIKSVMYAAMVLMNAEASAIHYHNLKNRPEDFGEDVRFLLDFGRIPSAVDYLQAQQFRRKLTQEFAEIFKEVDIIATPVSPFYHPDVGETHVYINGEQVDFLEYAVGFSSPPNLAGIPALCLPCGMSQGMPVAIQFLGRTFEEHVLLKAGHAFESTEPLGGAKPNLE